VRTSKTPRQMAYDQIKIDSLFLKKHNIMDYSLLMGIHDKRAGETYKQVDDSPPCICLSGDHHLYYFGIIDALQRWTWGKMLEKFLKVHFCCRDSEGVSSVDPDSYATRFLRAMEDLLVPKNTGTKYVRQSKYGAINDELERFKYTRGGADTERSDTMSETQSVVSDESTHRL